MATKKCFKCGAEKEISEFYMHKAMGDGHLNKCKECTKRDVKMSIDSKKDDPAWVEKERARGREKYRRLRYKDAATKKAPNSESKKRWRNMYPEKRLAGSAAQRLDRKKDHLHHWSYQKEHWKDCIDVSVYEHSKAHRFLVYDQERMMYRRSDNNELLDTREKHVAFIFDMIKNKPD
jgi:hypothetical protein